MEEISLAVVGSDREYSRERGSTERKRGDAERTESARAEERRRAIHLS
jgi:hypothetical protein